jgi:hypothetical protein
LVEAFCESAETSSGPSPAWSVRWSCSSSPATFRPNGRAFSLCAGRESPVPSFRRPDLGRRAWSTSLSRTDRPTCCASDRWWVSMVRTCKISCTFRRDTSLRHSPGAQHNGRTHGHGRRIHRTPAAARALHCTCRRDGGGWVKVSHRGPEPA